MTVVSVWASSYTMLWAKYSFSKIYFVKFAKMMHAGYFSTMKTNVTEMVEVAMVTKTYCIEFVDECLSGCNGSPTIHPHVKIPVLYKILKDIKHLKANKKKNSSFICSCWNNRSLRVISDLNHLSILENKQTKNIKHQNTSPSLEWTVTSTYVQKALSWATLPLWLKHINSC